MANEFVARNGIIALNDSQITGSLRLSNGSYSGSGLYLYDIPASGISGLNSGSNAVQSFSSPSTTWTFTHNLNSQYVIIQTYDTSDNQIIPQNIQLFNANSAVITFPTLEAGYAIATLGGSTINNIVVNISGSSGSFATTGSNTFIGNQLITGSVQVTGGTIIGTLTGNADTATTASFAQTASFVQNAQTASFVVTAQTASFVQTAQTASYVLNAVSASFATTAATASFANTLYQADGTITAARTITLGNNPLSIVGLVNTNRFHANGHLSLGTTVDGGSDLNVSGSVLIVGTLTAPSLIGPIGINGNTAITGSLISSGSITVTGSLGVSGSVTTPLDIVGTTTSRFFANGNVAVGTTTDVASAILQATSTTKGFLPPRMTTAQRNAISSPAQGLEVYDTDLVRPFVYNGTNWQPLIGPNSSNITIISGSLVVTGSVAVSTGSLTLSTGSITMPNRPAFRVVGTSSTNITATTTLSGSATSVDYNQGNNYNNTTGVFTAPIAGLYQVFLNARVGSNNSQMQAIVYKNTNVVQLMWEAPGLAASTHFGVSGIVNLAANDNLRVTVAVGSIQFDGNDSWGATYIG